MTQEVVQTKKADLEQAVNDLSSMLKKILRLKRFLFSTGFFLPVRVSPPPSFSSYLFIL